MLESLDVQSAYLLILVVYLALGELHDWYSCESEKAARCGAGPIGACKPAGDELGRMLLLLKVPTRFGTRLVCGDWAADLMRL